MDNWLNNNNIIRVVAVLVGILLWVIVRLDVQNSTGPSQPTTVSQTYTNVEVQVIGLDEERLTLMSYSPERVSLTVIGTAATLRRVSPDFKVLLNLTDVGPGEHLVSLTYEGIPADVQVVIDPPNAAVVIDEKERKEMPVTIRVSGEPAEGYIAGEPIVRPDRVGVTVESSVAENVASIVGEVDISGAREPVKREVRLKALDPSGEALDVPISPAVVEVEVPVTLPFKTVPLNISLTGQPPPGFAVESFEQSAEEVTVYAPQEVLDRIHQYEGLRIDLSRLRETQTFTFDVPLIEGAARVEPEQVTATVTIAEAMQAALGEIPVTLIGTHEDYEYSAGENGAGTITVTLEAAPSIVSQLTPDDIKAAVEVGGLPPGEYDLPVIFNLPLYAELAGETARTVRVIISEKAEDAAAAPGNGNGEEPVQNEEQEEEEPSSEEPSSSESEDGLNPGSGREDSAQAGPSNS